MPKGYFTDNGYMGLVDGKYMLFASEQDYYEYILPESEYFKYVLLKNFFFAEKSEPNMEANKPD